MRKWIQATLSLLALAGLLGICAPAWAQEVTASIVGTVTDSSGAPINGAEVTATDTDSADMQFPHDSDGHRLQVAIKDIEPGVRDGSRSPGLDAEQGSDGGEGLDAHDLASSASGKMDSSKRGSL